MRDTQEGDAQETPFPSRNPMGDCVDTPLPNA
jgi:hypothetical protein